jgi:hypothetical protein
MIMLGIAFEAIVAVLSGLAAAFVMTLPGWTTFRIVRHPEWAPPAVVFMLVLALGGALRSSEFLRMVVLFSVMAGTLVWFEGKAWRLRHAPKGQHACFKNSLAADIGTAPLKRRSKFVMQNQLKG